ncbi:uroporphyrinogen decarboxylase family protein [Sedimentisphaera salicampi]|uniref:Methylcobalamin:coenzyme M methyltransferase n=1 Tax=Sedimentisphaera salicampi TaxID=1941349 RepID=A0A1W6LJ06_9BACT|nr:uroporphyrinogen decarboxylase family protein [Sedimentisphaera salicampi]ARN55767.1 methylcobalamin:coenzyme M methyltransferase [Sedimentisphaera salicampi]OXU15963.1 methylcobalamin:coenzyme M methyltransferase [Sedimentisphaera salicampi]
MAFEPDYRNILSAGSNLRSERLALYEHIITPGFMEKVLDEKFADLEYSSGNDLDEFFNKFCGFFKKLTYDTVSYEVSIVQSLPHAGDSLMGKKPGPIQTDQDFDHFQWNEITEEFKCKAAPLFEALGNNMPSGMKAVGGPGNGVFEIAQDLVGMEYLAYMQYDNPELYAKIFSRIGNLMCEIWDWFLKNYSAPFCLCRIGDDLGYKSGTLISPQNIREHIVPQYAKIIQKVHNAGFKFLLHSCGNIFEVMNDFISIGIDAKHSNEDVIAPYEKWIELYSDRIGLFGGIDADFLYSSKDPNKVFEHVYHKGAEFRDSANGFALGSGNSIPDYVLPDSYLAMVEAAQKIRENEKSF